MHKLNSTKTIETISHRNFSVIERCLILIALVSILALLVDGAFSQLQMALNKGYLPPTIIKFKFLLLASTTLLVVLRGFVFPPTHIFAAWLVFIANLFVVSLVQLVSIDKPILVSWIEYLDNYSLILFLPLLFNLSRTVSTKQASKFIALIFLAVACLGLIQFLTNEPQVRPISKDGLFAVNSWTVRGKIRAFSLFTSGLRYGYFCAFVLALSLSQRDISITRKSRNWWTTIALLSIFCAATTLTRNVYLFCSAVLFSHAALPWLKKQGQLGVSSLLAIIFLAYLIVISLAPPLLEAVFPERATVLDTGSMSMRLELWSHYGSIWLQTDVVAAFFGTGLTQLSRFSLPGEGILVDNLLLGVGLQIGLFGLMSFLVLVGFMWGELVRRASSTKKRDFDFLVTTWAPFLGAGLLNSTQAFFLPIFFLLIMLTEDSK